MEINNLELIRPFIDPIDENDFWFCQILRRKKENPDNTSNSRVIKTYYIRSADHLEERFGEMMILSKYHRARVYINLNRRNFEQLGLQMMKKVADCLINRTYRDIRNAYNSVCGNFHVEKEKKWIVDLDDNLCSLECEEEGIIVNKDYLPMVIRLITGLGGVIYAGLPTLNGTHLITSPFNSKLFYDNILAERAGLVNLPDIQKNNPTLLYYSDDEIVTMPQNILDKFSGL